MPSLPSRPVRRCPGLKSVAYGYTLCRYSSTTARHVAVPVASQPPQPPRSQQACVCVRRDVAARRSRSQSSRSSSSLPPDVSLEMSTPTVLPSRSRVYSAARCDSTIRPVCMGWGGRGVGWCGDGGGSGGGGSGDAVVAWRRRQRQWVRSGVGGLLRESQPHARAGGAGEGAQLCCWRGAAGCGRRVYVHFKLIFRIV